MAHGSARLRPTLCVTRAGEPATQASFIEVAQPHPAIQSFVYVSQGLHLV